MGLKGKNVILGVCGGIAAYKTVELLRLFKKAGANVRVVMTRSALEFVGETTFRVLSENEVCTGLFNTNESSVRHIEWATDADLMVVAPATANFVGKMANGIADDALTTMVMAVTAPVIVCPSMNTHMYENLAVQRNLDILEQDGVLIVEPGTGELACKTTGAGRLPDPCVIFDRGVAALVKKDLKGKKFLISAGPTREAIDPVRYISNHSSGKMGYALAAAAEKR
jgi:phosphopantothenoylcysteine decarboxylase/phosphopantothenate--cysteine ligase